MVPQEMLDCMKKERPQLYKNFKPSKEQIAFFIISNCRDLIDSIDTKSIKKDQQQIPDSKRMTRSNKSVTPGEKFPV